MLDFRLEVPRATETSKTATEVRMMSRILIITPKQPSGNPRMRKAADALARAGNTVHVLYAFNATGPPKQMRKFWRKPNGHGNELADIQRRQIHLFHQPTHAQAGRSTWHDEVCHVPQL